ncbi:MAG TPA: PIN domain-containing protein [Thermoanaerobaculia bacterium]|nr:PIN domain-containing protein [Thermoanaerobaculia bacterium]
MIRWLLDTGPMVAYLDARDPAHQEVAALLDPFAGHLVTTSAVITEAMHFVAQHRRGPRLLAELITASPIAIYDLSRPPELHDAVALMEKYADTPMDFADATLLLLAEALGSYDILTLDRRGFSTFRTRDGQPLRLVLR